jgi:hypothetical protein
VRKSRATGSPINGPDRDLTPGQTIYTGQPSRFSSQPLDRDPTDQIQPFNLNRVILQRKPQVFPYLQPGPSTLGKPLQLGPIFFSLARDLVFIYILVPKLVLAVS